MKRPTTLLVFGVLNLAFAAQGILASALVATVFFLAPLPGGHGELEGGSAVARSMAFLVIALALGLVQHVLQGISGVGLLTVKSWGRTAAIAYAFSAVVVAVVLTLAYFWTVVPLMGDVARGPGGREFAPFSFGMFVPCMFCIGLTYPAILLCFMFRPNVIAAFQQRDDASPPGAA